MIKSPSARAFTILCIMLVGCGGATSYPSSSSPGSDTTTQAPKQEQDASEKEPHAAIVSFSGLGFFSEENKEARAMVAQWAKKRGWPLADMKTADMVFEHARTGKSPTGGESCGMPLDRYMVLRRYQEQLGADSIIRARVNCDARDSTCDLTVRRVPLPESYESKGEGFVASYNPSKAWRLALAESLQMLEPEKDDGKGGLFGIGTLGSGPAVSPQPVQMSYSARPSSTTVMKALPAGESGLRFPAGDKAVRACLSDTLGATVSVNTRLSDAGKVVRCEPTGAEHKHAGCLCEAVKQGAQFHPLLHGKNVGATTRLRAASVVTDGNQVVRAHTSTYVEKYDGPDGQPRFRPSVSDVSIEDWRPPHDDNTSNCFQKLHGQKPVDISVEVRFDERGQASATSVLGTRQGDLSKEAIACVEKLFMKSSAPCPAVPKTSARATINVFLRDLKK